MPHLADMSTSKVRTTTRYAPTHIHYNANLMENPVVKTDEFLIVGVNVYN